MQDLNRNQVVLLVLLISFVTSIATGIITVSLLQEAPIEVTRNINSIVEKTIQTVTTPGTVTQEPQQKEVTTVVVKEEDLVISSINKNIKSIARITETDGITGEKTFYGIGLVVTKEGLIESDRKTITSGNVYIASMSDGTSISLTPVGVDKQTNLLLFRGAQDKDLKTPYVYIPATLSDSEPKLGQTVISLGGDTENAVSVGRVTSLEMKDSTVSTTTPKYLANIDTDVSGKDLVVGSPLFNLSGDVIGIRILSDMSKTFLPISVLKKEILIITATSTPKT